MGNSAENTGGSKKHVLIEQAIQRRDKLVKNAEQALEVLAHGDPKDAERLKEFRENNAQIDEVLREPWYKRMLKTPAVEKKLPVGMKIFGALCMVFAVFGIFYTASSAVETVQYFMSGKMDELGTSTIVVTFIRLALLMLLAVGFLIFGVRLLQGKRNYAAVIIYGFYVILIGGFICSLMLFGVSWRLAIHGVAIGVLIAFQVYLDPYLREERQLHRMLHDKVIKKEQEAGVLGRDISGKGYIKLDFFNLFWIFVVCCFLGDVMESIFHVLVVDPGHWQDRAGLLFGPLSPIYGFGAVLMTLFLNRFYNKNAILIFFLSAIIGGLFEAFVSYFMQYTFGAVAWDYTGQFLSLFGGRTCGLAMFAWGLLGVLWIKFLLPFMLWLIDKIPWNWRYTITVVAAVLIAADCIMSLQAFDCWYERLSGKPIVTPIQQFYGDYFNNDFMTNRFQSMSINPDTAVRGGH